MKRLHRRMTPLLAKQLKEQKIRIELCGFEAHVRWTFGHTKYAREQGTYFTTRPKR